MVGRPQRRNLPPELELNHPLIHGKITSIYMPAETYNKVLAKAHEENRSISNMVEVLCNRGLKRNPE